MQLGYSRPPLPVLLSSQHRYSAEELLQRINLLHTIHHAIWIATGARRYISLQECEFSLACQLVAAEHDDIVGADVPHDDGWSNETCAMEMAATEHMENSCSDEEHAVV